MTGLDDRLHAAIADVPGEFAWVVEDPATGEASRFRDDETFPGASTLKVAVLAQLLHLIDAGTVRLHARLTLRAWHQVGGAGVLQYFAPGTEIQVADAATLMIALSDNTATNMLLDLTGCAPASATIGDGRSAIRRYYGKPGMPLPDARPYTAIATAAGLASIYRRVLRNDILSDATRALFWQALGRQADRTMMPRLFPDPVAVAHKTGAIDGVRHDAGVFWVPEAPGGREAPELDPMAIRGTTSPQGRPIILVVLTQSLGDQRWSVDNAGAVAIGRLARAAYDWFAQRE